MLEVGSNITDCFLEEAGWAWRTHCGEGRAANVVLSLHICSEGTMVSQVL